MLRGAFWITIGLIFFLPIGLGAEEKKNDVSSLIADIPTPNDKGTGPIPINSSTILRYRGIVPLELVGDIRDGILEAKTFREASIKRVLQESWMKNESEAQPPLGERGALGSQTVFGQHLPFKITDSGGDPTTTARMVLWNSIAVWAGRGSLLLDFTLRSLDESKNGGNAYKGALKRVFPKEISSVDKTSQLFREKIAFSQPGLLSGYAWLTFRFFGSDEDLVWVYSPAIKKVRQMTGSNRTDNLVRTSVSADDFLSWSGTIQNVTPTLDRVAPYIIPVPSLVSSKLTPSGKCFVGMAASEGTSDGAVDDIIRESTDPSGFSSSVRFIVQDLYRIELAPEDPYSQYGRQVVYVDRSLSVPVYKFVYDRSGSPLKAVITSYGVGVTPDGAISAPLPSASIVWDRKQKGGTVITYERVTFCPEGSPELLVGDFDPRKLDPAQAQSAGTPAPAQSPTAVADVGNDDD